MVVNNYQAGQVVKVDVPDTYGIISKVLEADKSYDSTKKYNPHDTYSGPRVVVKFMEPQQTLPFDEYESIESSTYPLHHKFFGKKFRVINPEEEISKLEIELNGMKEYQLQDKRAELLSETIKFLRNPAEYVPRRETTERRRLYR